MNSSSSIPKTRIQFFIGLLIFFQADMPDLKGQSYCIPGSSICSDYRNLRIDSVAFGTIHNVSGCGVNGYTDYTSNVKPANITAGTYVPVYVKSGNSPFSNKNVIMAIDFNHNGKFDADEITSLNSVGASASASVRIPFTSLEGNTRMRITIGDFSGEMAMCNNTGYGETEDYLINILPAETPGSGFTFYVNKSAAGTSDGLSWANAFTSISEAMYYAKGRDTIKVAKGYYIQKSTLDIKDSIILKGGYPDTGTPSDKDRDFSRNQTIVTGKPENYQFPFDNLTILFRAIQYASSIKMNFMIDGFIFENAYSNALYVQSATSAEIRNCVFRENNSSTEGAALNCINSKIIIGNCFFDSNNYTSAKTIINCTENSSTEFTNCVFSNNAGSNGVVYTNQSTSSFTNCSFVNNWNYYKTIFADNYSTVRIKNSIFYNNRSVNSLDSSEIQLTSSVAIVSNTITQGYDYGNSNLFAKDPKFNDVTNIAGNDNLYFTKDDGLQLINPCSPAINAGLNQSIAAVENDILGNQRIFGSQVDLGAYEVQSEITEIPGTLYVNKRATGANDGSSWADAFTDLQRALHFCSDTIRIAAGSYVLSDHS